MEISLLCLALFLWFYRYVTKGFGKWEALGIPCISGTFPHGSHLGKQTRKTIIKGVIKAINL